jgi:FkbM family methyltransferase
MEEDEGMQLHEVLSAFSITPVLVDVGASGNIHSSWSRLARTAICLGFDPDNRDLPASFASAYAKPILEPSAVVPDVGQRMARFNLTRSPYCSSLLLPDQTVLQDYSFRDLFEIVGHVDVPATTLDLALTKNGLDRIDWLKLDTQGLDLSLLQSLSKTTSRRLKVVEVEPGFRSFYAGEERFDQVHAYMLDQGFLLAALSCQEYAPAPPETVSALSKATRLPESHLHSLAGRVPTAAEATYIRKAGFYSAGNDEIDCMLHIACACALGQYSFAVYLINSARLTFPQANPLLEALQAHAESETAALRNLATSSSLLRSWLRRNLPKVVLDRLQQLRAAARAR